MRPPEYAAVVTGVFSRVIREGTPPTEEELKALRIAFSRQGFTDGYFTGKKGPEMLGIREEESSQEARRLFASAKKYYLNNEFQRIPVEFSVSVDSGTPIQVEAWDDRGNVFKAEGPVPEPAFHRETTPAMIQTALQDRRHALYMQGRQEHRVTGTVPFRSYVERAAPFASGRHPESQGRPCYPARGSV